MHLILVGCIFVYALEIHFMMQEDYNLKERLILNSWVATLIIHLGTVVTT